jgi:hypothetical protein
MSRYIVPTCRVGVLSGILTVGGSLFAAQSPQILSSTKSAITEEMIGRKYSPAKLKDAAKDAEYGYSEKTPILVGGGFGKGFGKYLQIS